jgi:hypothetical protein
MTHGKRRATEAPGQPHLLRYQFRSSGDRPGSSPRSRLAAADEFDPNSHLKERPTVGTSSPRCSVSEWESIPCRIRLGPTSSW